MTESAELERVQITGRISVHPRGFGFVNADVSAFVAPPLLNPFLADDVVTAEVEEGSDGRRTATCLALASRTRCRLFGEIVERRGQPWLQVDREVSNTDWPLAGAAGLRGRFAVARIEDARLVLERVLDPTDDHALERILCRYGLRTEHSAEALAEAAAVPDVVPLGHRRDLRGLPTITVDDASTRDIDDAVSALPAASDGAMRLLVSIADPSEYVTPGTALDDEARARGTSVYLPGRVLPMLPEAISADRLSLHPGVDRPCLTAELRIDTEGGVTAVDIYESVIRSSARVTYEEMQAWLDEGVKADGMRGLGDLLPWLRTAASRLAIARARRGGVSMTREETSLRVDAESGAVVGIERRPSSAAHLMIERFMVAANEAVAVWLESRGVPAVYRVHAEPDPVRVADLSACAHHFGYEAGFSRTLSPLALAAFEAQIGGRAAEPAIRAVMLRMLGPARYTVKPAPHFGLAAPRYLHFTSPLRRYADLAVHRVVKAYLRGQRAFVPLDPEVDALAAHLDACALAASRAENDRRRVLSATWMQRHVGEVFEARIVRVRPFGLVAQIDSSLVEGLVPLESLPGRGWRPDEREISLSDGERVYAVGMAVRVRVASTDPEQGRIEYALVEG